MHRTVRDRRFAGHAAGLWKERYGSCFRHCWNRVRKRTVRAYRRLTSFCFRYHGVEPVQVLFRIRRWGLPSGVPIDAWGATIGLTASHGMMNA